MLVWPFKICVENLRLEGFDRKLQQEVHKRALALGLLPQGALKLQWAGGGQPYGFLIRDSAQLLIVGFESVRTLLPNPEHNSSSRLQQAPLFLP